MIIIEKAKRQENLEKAGSLFGNKTKGASGGKEQNNRTRRERARTLSAWTWLACQRAANNSSLTNSQSHKSQTIIGSLDPLDAFAKALLMFITNH